MLRNSILRLPLRDRFTRPFLTPREECSMMSFFGANIRSLKLEGILGSSTSTQAVGEAFWRIYKSTNCDQRSNWKVSLKKNSGYIKVGLMKKIMRLRWEGSRTQ